ncbi:DUF4129 domain-containing protein [Actinoplanes sp. NPDC051859]|uniref:DUF4129 domain-containing protein n=1 Tax=Actinoplanes sp. NPDC051859 TaxID=3363909 RepID=UPI0037B11822
MNPAALRRWWPLAAVLALLFLAALAATRSAPQLERFDPNAGFEAAAEPSAVPLLPPTNAPTKQPPVEAARELPSWIGTAALVVLGLAVLTVLGLAAWALLRGQTGGRRRRGGRRARNRTDSTAAEDIVAAVDAGLQELSDTDRDPRRAVIACWVRLEQAAAAAGTPRHAGDSPTELVERLLAEQQLDAAVLTPFAHVYREARYATHTVDDRMRQQAVSALERLRSDLGAGVSA